MHLDHLKGGGGAGTQGGKDPLSWVRGESEEQGKRMFNHHRCCVRARSETSMCPSFLVLFLSNQKRFLSSAGLASNQLFRQKNKGLLPDMNYGAQEGEEKDGGEKRRLKVTWVTPAVIPLLWQEIPSLLRPPRLKRRWRVLVRHQQEDTNTHRSHRDTPHVAL